MMEGGVSGNLGRVGITIVSSSREAGTQTEGAPGSFCPGEFAEITATALNLELGHFAQHHLLNFKEEGDPSHHRDEMSPKLGTLPLPKNPELSWSLLFSALDKALQLS